MYNYKTISLSSHSLQFIVTSHLLVQLHLHLVEEVGTAVVLPSENKSSRPIALHLFRQA